MGDRHYPSNSNLVLRVLPPLLQIRLRDKMSQAEEEIAQRLETSSSHQQQPAILGLTTTGKDDHIVALDGVQCIPSEDGSTLWHFEMDGISYPARLTNLPCPVEIHKTFDHAHYYKCVDIGQMLIVYEDENEMEEIESAPEYRVEGFPSYYYSGLTPPMKRVVERRFAAREHKSIAPPRAEVADIEKELKSLIATISRDASKMRGKNTSASAAMPSEASKVIEEVVDDIVTYEQWMDDFGNQPRGIEFDEKDKLCTTHPEVWLKPEEYEAILDDGTKKKERKKESKEKTKSGAISSSGTKKKTTKKKKESTKKKKDTSAMLDDTISLSSSIIKPKKKGIAAKKNRDVIAPDVMVDEVDQAAAQIVAGDDGDALEVLGDLFDFNAEDDIADFLAQDM